VAGKKQIPSGNNNKKSKDKSNGKSKGFERKGR